MNDGSRVSQRDVEDAIKDKTFTVLPDGRTTVCQLTLDNGFTVEGFSACVAIENFDAEIGNRISYERAKDEVWKMLGFRLADKRAGVRSAGMPPELGMGYGNKASEKADDGLSFDRLHSASVKIVNEETKETFEGWLGSTLSTPEGDTLVVVMGARPE